MVIRFKVPALRGQGRPRFSKRSRAYKDKKDVEYERLIRECFLKEAKDIEPSERPIAIKIEAHYKLAKNTPKYVREMLFYNDFNYVPQSKPDLDNIAKSVLDALNGVAYIDDKQIYSLTCNKSFDIESDISYLDVEVGYFQYNTLEDIKRWRK